MIRGQPGERHLAPCTAFPRPDRGDALACWAAGNCVVAGELGTFGPPGVVNEVRGVWGRPEAVPGTTGGFSVWVGCATGRAGHGYCVVGGYNDGFGGAFVAAGRNGKWGTAVPRPCCLGGAVGFVSCPSAGSCVVAGSVGVQSQVNGVWGAGVKLPGTGIKRLVIESLSCGAPGNCGVGGQYELYGGLTEPFVASETDGVWTAPEPVPGVLVLNVHRSPRDVASAVSCPSAGHCTAVGSYSTLDDRQLGFVTGPSA